MNQNGNGSLTNSGPFPLFLPASAVFVQPGSNHMFSPGKARIVVDKGIGSVYNISAKKRKNLEERRIPHGKGI